MGSDQARIVEVTGEFRHAVRIEAGGLATIASRLAAHGIAVGTKVLVVADRNACAPHADLALRGLASAGHPTSLAVLDAEERLKSTAAVEAVWKAGLKAQLGRRDLMVVVGGGLVGDVGGFAAASYLRGVRLIQCPTTLLAMVDASTGGKTGINLPLPDGSLGKNLAGAFWPPLEVIVDPGTLATLPPRELSSGLAECVKHAILDGEDHLAFLEASVDSIRALDRGVLLDLLERSVAVKARVVSSDPRERGERALLNLGHTFGHAIETLPDVDLTHGEAVAIGLVAACTASEAGGQATGLRARIVQLLTRCGLPTRLPRAVAAEAIEARMGFDKKAQAGKLRFVLPRGVGDVQFDQSLDERALAEAMRAIGAR